MINPPETMIDLNEGWHYYLVYYIIVYYTDTSISSDLAIDLEFSWYLISSYRMIRGKNSKNVWQVVQNEETG